MLTKKFSPIVTSPKKLPQVEALKNVIENIFKPLTYIQYFTVFDNDTSLQLQNFFCVNAVRVKIEHSAQVLLNKRTNIIDNMAKLLSGGNHDG